MSAPAQKPRPAPVSTMTRTPGSSLARRIAARSASPRPAVKALRRSGRFSVSVAMRCETSYRTSVSAMARQPISTMRCTTGAPSMNSPIARPSVLKWSVPRCALSAPSSA